MLVLKFFIIVICLFGVCYRFWCMGRKGILLWDLYFVMVFFGWWKCIWWDVVLRIEEVGLVRIDFVVEFLDVMVVLLGIEGGGLFMS